MLSTHKVEVVGVQLLPHPNADSLSIVNIHGYQVVVRTEDWLGRDRGAYIPPDNVVDTTRDEFSFLGKHSRVRARKLRGIVSFGLLIPCNEPIGTDVTELLGVTHYEPVEEFTTLNTYSNECRGPHLYYPKYDIESGRRYGKYVFKEGEQVYITEKIHGANAKIVFHNNQLYVGSRNRWCEEGDNIYWNAMGQDVRDYCEHHPDWIVFGEVYGQVQKGFPYDCAKDTVKFRAFDVMVNGSYLDVHDCPDLMIPWVPVIGIREYNFDKICEMAEGKSLIADHIREGVVVKPLINRWDHTIGRSILKWVGAGYLEK